jgi:hypothetical protein
MQTIHPMTLGNMRENGAIFIDAQLEFLVVRCCRNRMPMRQFNMLCEITDSLSASFTARSMPGGK